MRKTITPYCHWLGNAGGFLLRSLYQQWTSHRHTEPSPAHRWAQRSSQLSRSPSSLTFIPSFPWGFETSEFRYPGLPVCLYFFFIWMGRRWHRSGFIISLDFRTHSPLSLSPSLTYLYFSLNSKHPGTSHQTRARTLIMVYPCRITFPVSSCCFPSRSNSGWECGGFYSFVPCYFWFCCFVRAIGTSKEYIV